MIVIYVFLVIIGVILIIAAILPTKYNIKKEITINKPAAHVYERIANLNYYRDWNPWHKME